MSRGILKSCEDPWHRACEAHTALRKTRLEPLLRFKSCREKRSRCISTVGSKGVALSSYFRTRTTASSSESFDVARRNAGNDDNQDGAEERIKDHSLQDDSLGVIIDLVSEEEMRSIAVHPIRLDTEQLRPRRRPFPSFEDEMRSIALNPIMLDAEQLRQRRRAFPSASTMKATMRRQLMKRPQRKTGPRMKIRTRTNTKKSACCVARSQ